MDETSSHCDHVCPVCVRSASVCRRVHMDNVRNSDHWLHSWTGKKPCLTRTVLFWSTATSHGLTHAVSSKPLCKDRRPIAVRVMIHPHPSVTTKLSNESAKRIQTPQLKVIAKRATCIDSSPWGGGKTAQIQ